MHKENFDSQLRQKLESIQPEYNEKAWERLKKSLPVPWYASFLRDYGGAVYGGLTTLALISTYFYTQNLKKENQILNDKINTIKVDTVQTESVKRDTVWLEKNNHDTVYITKYKYIYKDLKDAERINGVYQKIDKEYNLPLEASKLGDESVVNEKLYTRNEIKNLNYKSGRGNIPSAKNSNSKALNSPKSVSANNSIGKLDSKANKEDLGNNLTSNFGKLNDAAEKQKSAASEANVLTPQPTESKNGLLGEKTSTETVFSDKLMEETNDRPELIIPESIQSLTASPEAVAVKKPSVITKKVFNIGLLSDLGFGKGVGFGPVAEFFLGKNWSINAGLLVTNFIQQNFHGSDDFTEATGNKFQDHFKDDIIKKFSNKPPDKIHEIDVRTQFIKMPLFVNYYLPMKKGISFVLSSGTKLNLKTTEKVKFEAGNLGEETKDGFDAHPKTKIFNNLYYGMGAQYSYKRFSTQVLPYYEYQFTKTTSSIGQNKFGVNVFLKYGLKK